MVILNKSGVTFVYNLFRIAFLRLLWRPTKLADYGFHKARLNIDDINLVSRLAEDVVHRKGSTSSEFSATVALDMGYSYNSGCRSPSYGRSWKQLVLPCYLVVIINS